MLFKKYVHESSTTTSLISTWLVFQSQCCFHYFEQKTELKCLCTIVRSVWNSPISKVENTCMYYSWKFTTFIIKWCFHIIYGQTNPPLNMYTPKLDITKLLHESEISCWCDVSNWKVRWKCTDIAKLVSPRRFVHCVFLLKYRYSETKLVSILFCLQIQHAKLVLQDVLSILYW